MKSKLKPYSSTRSSNVDWLGEIPTHWEVAPLKRLCSEYALYGANINSDQYTDSGVRFLRTSDINKNGEIKEGGVFLPKSLVSDYLLKNGDLIISRSGTVGRSFLYEIDLHGICSYAGYLVRFVPSAKVIPRYLYLFTHTQAFSDFVKIKAISSTIQNVNAEKFASCMVLLPSKSEQKAIVHYLDYMDQRIQKFVQSKKKLVELYIEQKQAIINSAVTRGINPAVQLKNSGIEWLGEIPKHWHVHRLRTITKLLVSNVDKHQKMNEEFVQLCNYVDVYKNDYINENIQFMSATATKNEIDKFHLLKNDVVITKDSETWNDIGVPALVTTTISGLICGYHLAILRPINQSTISGFLFRALQSKAVAKQFSIKSKGVTRYGLSHDDVKSVKIPLPTVQEQTAIVEYLHDTIEKIDKNIDLCSRQIDLMQEYRCRLISDVVTGKLDVRKTASNLPKSNDDPDTLNQQK